MPNIEDTIQYGLKVLCFLLSAVKGNYQLIFPDLDPDDGILTASFKQYTRERLTMPQQLECLKEEFGIVIKVCLQNFQFLMKITEQVVSRGATL
jgi:hypothetical protein